MKITAGSLSAIELIDYAENVFGVSSHYALAKIVGLPPGYVQRYYRKNRLPASSRLLIIEAISVK